MGKAWDGSKVAYDVDLWREVLRCLKPGAHLLAFGGTRTRHRMVCAVEDAGFEIRDEVAWTYGQGFPKSKNLDGEWHGWGTALKPAWEPIIMARKPLSERTVEANVARWRTGAINIDASRIVTSDGTSRTVRAGGANVEQWRMGKGDQQTGGSPLGRWPANLMHDGSQGVLDLFPQKVGGKDQRSSAARYFASFPPDAAPRLAYCAKADKTDRMGSSHPTVKPRALMRYLCRLVTPPGGTVLDPFAGSGTTLYAARDEGFGAVGIEQEAEYVAHIESQLASSRPTSLALDHAR